MYNLKNLKVDSVLTTLYFLYVVVYFYYACMQQSIFHGHIPQSFLFIPFGLILVYLWRIFCLKNRFKTNKLFFLFLLWIIYFNLSHYYYYTFHNLTFNYATIIYTTFFPIAFLYFYCCFYSSIILTRLTVNLNIIFTILLSIIFFYFIPYSINDRGIYASLNTAYYILFAYPLCMLSRNKLLKGACTILMLLAVFFSMKRGGIVAAILGFIGYYVGMLLLLRRKVIKGIITMLFLSIIIGYSLYIVDEYSDGRISERFERTKDDHGNEARTDIYRHVFNAIESSSFSHLLLGHGGDTAKLLSSDGYTAHNDFLEFLYDYGIGGLVLLLLLHFSLLRISIRSIRNQRLWAFSATYSYVTILVLSLVSHVVIMGYFMVLLPFWATISSLEHKNGNI